MKEPILEPILRRLRIRKVLPTIRQYPDCHLLDIGCGWDCRLLKTVAPFIGFGVGIDFKVQELELAKIKTIRMMITETLPFPAESFDVVTMLAVLEHLTEPVGMVREIERILKKGGSLVLTVPSIIAQPVLEFLSYRLGIVNVDEIRDHKKYYDYKELKKLFSQTGMVMESHRYFQMGMNNFSIVKKAAQ
jgi:ubiquinone/menaquinone biosynthesis C-methylase UbiE